jgi:hypothetical protein
MASGGVVKFPYPITFDDDVPKVGFVRLILTVKEMIVHKSFGKTTHENTQITATFDNGAVFVQANVTAKDGQQIQYEYKKQLPFDVIARQCKYKVTAKNEIVVTLAKAKNESWASLNKYFLTEKNE